ncbi:hypothetical protein TNCV_2464151 [Trichonephila clavipes]|nr:hypothetical protein TNCV_2464151 [Trichonephila clavipes]
MMILRVDWLKDVKSAMAQNLRVGTVNKLRKWEELPQPPNSSPSKSFGQMMTGGHRYNFAMPDFYSKKRSNNSHLTV